MNGYKLTVFNVRQSEHGTLRTGAINPHLSDFDTNKICKTVTMLQTNCMHPTRDTSWFEVKRHSMFEIAAPVPVADDEDITKSINEEQNPVSIQYANHLTLIHPRQHI